MPTERSVFAQRGMSGTLEYDQVIKVSNLLLDHLNTPQALADISNANQPGLSSAQIQATFEPYATELGFRCEAKGLFAEYDNNALRPDYYLPVGTSGILLEVERGKTTINNMDLLDIWKCHLCATAHHLFLMVPLRLQQSASGRVRKEYNTVMSRVGSFFKTDGNYINVRSVHLFGY